MTLFASFRLTRCRVFSQTFAVIALIAGSTAQLGATTIVTNEVFNWSGACVDCSGTVTGTLTLTSAYVQGTTITTGTGGTFVSFTYNGSNLLSTFTINNSPTNLSVSGNIPASLPGPANIEISTPTVTFATGTFAGGVSNWCAGSSCGADHGTTSTFSATHEPTSLALLGAGLGAFGLLRRRRNRQTSR
jgi:hypothetical protein